MLSVLIITALINNIHAYSISVYGDVYKDTQFFTKTFPWIIDNVGGHITIDYYLLGSGRYTVPQMCALNDIRENTFLQAQYLKCEAEGKPSEYCLCETGIDPQRFKACVRTEGSSAATAADMFSRLKINTSPIIELGSKNTIFQVEDTWFLKKICTIFGDHPPMGCVKPFDCNSTEIYVNKKAIAQFDTNCLCNSENGCQTSDITTTTTSLPQPSYS